MPSQLTQGLHGKPAHTWRSKIRESVDYVDRHPGDGITAADLATMAGVSERALQTGFRELVGMSPTAYLRGVRLGQVHRERICGAAVFVTDIAARFGFLPSETVQRARR